MLLGGCSLAPQYTRPDAPVADNFPIATEPGTIQDIGWREFFVDPQLQALIAAALEHNRNLQDAALAIEQARGLYRIQRSERLPSVNATATYSMVHTPAAASPIGQGFDIEQYQVGMGISAFELDFFGRVRSLSKAALAEYLATEEAFRSARISLVAEVARAWLAERTYAEQLVLAAQALKLREQAHELARQRFEGGVSSELDLRQAEILVESARVSMASLSRQRAQAGNALTLLVGAPITTLPPAAPLAEQQVITDLPAGLPSDLLQRRPDIRAAEQRLMAAHANIGAARAAFFPRISLTATAGTASGELTGLFAPGTAAWSFVPQLTLPIFTWGRNRANLDVAEVRKDRAIVAYERAIQVAFREVADALVARDSLDEQLAAQERLLQAQVARVTLARQRYEGGVASYLEVLEAERALFEAEQAMVQTRQLRLANAVDLYRALGGGIEGSEMVQPPEPEVRDRSRR